jgi:hypothetical protein
MGTTYLLSLSRVQSREPQEERAFKSQQQQAHIQIIIIYTRSEEPPLVVGFVSTQTATIH